MADAVETPAEDELTITFRKPIVVGGETYTSVNLQEPTAAQWLLWSDLEGLAADIKAVAIVGGIPEPAVRQMGARDLRKASEFIATFLA